MTVVDLFTSDRERESQEEAADPTLSVFVTANAGSGKTTTLINRVARLLLAKADPQTILCVTYTKAAASEMQRRLFQVLGGWSVASDAELRQALGKLRSRTPASFDRQELSDARGLFAAALETPGGLKIQTIHAFCEKVLRRFPLEAGVAPGFKVMDEPAAAAVAQAARRDVAHHVLAIPGDLADAYGRLSVALDFRRFQAMFAEFEARRGKLDQFLRERGGLEGAIAWVWRTVDMPPGTDPSTLAAEGMAGMDRSLYRRAAEALRSGSAGVTDVRRAETLAALAVADAPSFDEAVALFFTKEGEPAKWIGSSKRLKDAADLQILMLSEQERLENVRARMRAAQVGRDSVDAISLAAAYLAAYEVEKEATGALDFADLVDRTRNLLRDGDAAAWVLFKLDGGIDHILLDEAQDTSPEQWDIVDALTDDFFSGEGRRPQQRLDRAMFVVGDRKQSIYSFQGARPELLLEKYEFHHNRATGAGYRFRQLDLLQSWRSTPQVLTFVDTVFAPPHLSEAVQPGAEVRHTVAEPRRAHVGCVDVWDLEVEPRKAERDAWDLPLDVEADDSANRRLARRIATEIRALIDRGDGVYDGAKLRPADEGDILILVRRRGVLFEEILRALKRADLRVAGADRLSLTAHIIFDDLLALARFALFPGDQLTLAALLKSPFCGLDDDALYRLAHGREAEGLWARLRRRAGEDPAWAEAAAFLTLALETSRAARPFEFFVRLTEHTTGGRSMRQRLLRRLGAEAKDALDEFLNQVLAAETRGAHDLETLVDELAGLEIVVKREMEAVRREVRVMTAHGAKGLEAPIVFLPETTLTQTQRPPPLLAVDRGAEGAGFLWAPRSAGDCPPTAAARAERNAREEAEAYRLLYVALTRARDRLVLCGRRSDRTNEDKIRGWWGAIREALAHAGIADEVRELTDAAGGKFRRYGADPARASSRRAAEPVPTPLPAWTAEAVPAEAFARYASPSDLGEGAVAAAPSPLAVAQGLGRFRRGDLVHRLLQLLPDLPPPERADGAAKILARESDLTAEQRAEMAGAALSVLEDVRFAEVFGPGSRAEVAIAGAAAALPAGLSISGRIDRLVTLPDRVLVVDFKTNRPSPDRIEAADPAYLRQMALYAAVLADIFPGRRIEAAIVWTDGPKLMPIPENLLARTLADLSHTG